MNTFHTFSTVPMSKMTSFTSQWVHICPDTLMGLNNRNLKFIISPKFPMYPKLKITQFSCDSRLVFSTHT